MKNITGVLSLLIAILFSCNTSTNDKTLKDVEKSNVNRIGEMKDEPNVFNSDSIVTILQGKWRETEYPYRVAHFKNSTVKFIEEGIVEEPAFREFAISQKCDFKVNNIKNAKSDDIFLVMADRETCDILNVAGDSLVLSGFSVNTNEGYKIIYRKTDE